MQFLFPVSDGDHKCVGVDVIIVTVVSSRAVSSGQCDYNCRGLVSHHG